MFDLGGAGQLNRNWAQDGQLSRSTVCVCENLAGLIWNLRGWRSKLIHTLEPTLTHREVTSKQLS